MRTEAPYLELDRLRKEQAQTRADEVFGGLSPKERAAYDVRQNRIHRLENDLSTRSEERPRNPAVSWKNR
jgi:hypothetical protein